MSTSTAGWFAWLVGGLAVTLAVSAGLLIELNGDEIGSSDTTGSAILAISFAGVGAFVASRRPGNLIGWVLLIGGFFNSLNAFSFEYAKYTLVTNPGLWPGGPFIAWLSTWAFALGFAAQPLTLLLFPTGRLLSARWRPILWLIMVGVTSIVVPMAVAAWPLRGPELLSDDLWAYEIGGGLAVALQRGGVALVGLGFFASVTSLALRFRQATGEERQQIKWLVYAGALTLIILVTVSPAAPFDLPYGIERVFDSLSLLILPSIPLTIGIAILKYRLYDIDVIINRTLVYGALTVSLVAVYFSSVVLLQAIFRTLTGQESQLAVVASTLAIAALFNPLRHRIQSFIDHRFYRRKYDAAKTLEAFASKARDQTDLEKLCEDLAEVVDETLQPSHISLWLNFPSSPKRSESSSTEVRMSSRQSESPQ